MQDFVLISVIIPTYNRAYCLERAVRSVLNQTYKNLELIIVDDCSTDNTEQVVSAIQDQRIKYIRLDKNLGPSKARNAGIKIAKGKYIAFQDSDDEWHLDKLEKQLAVMQADSSCLMTFSKYKIMGESPIIVPKDDFFDVSSCEHGMLDIFLNEPKAGTPAMLIRKDALDDIGFFNESFSTLEDWELSLRLAKKGKIIFLNDILLDVYVTQGGVNSSSSEKKLDALLYILKLYWSDFKRKKIFKSLIQNICFQFPCISDERKKRAFAELDEIILGSENFFETIDGLVSEKDGLVSHLRELDAHIDFLGSNIKTLQSENEGLAAEKDGLVTHLHEQDSHIEFLGSNIKALQSDNERLAAEKEGLVTHLHKLDAHIEVLGNRIRELERDLAAAGEENKKLAFSVSFEKFKKSLAKKIVRSFCDNSLPSLLSGRVAVYGAGEVAQVLLPLCRKAGVEIPFTIDRKPKVVDEVPSFNMEQIPDRTIPIVITTYDPERALRSQLEQFVSAPVRYLDELLPA